MCQRPLFLRYMPCKLQLCLQRGLCTRSEADAPGNPEDMSVDSNDRIVPDD